MNGRTAIRDSPTLNRSSRPASELRYSGSNNGPATSRRTITGTASKNPAPHQNRDNMKPPSIGPNTLPPMKQLVHTAMAVARCLGSLNRLVIRARVEGARVAAAAPIRARGGDEHLVSGGVGSEHGGETEEGTPDQQQLAAPHPVAKGSHGDEEPREHESVDVQDPQLLGTGGQKILRQLGERQEQHAQIHRHHQRR